MEKKMENEMETGIMGFIGGFLGVFFVGKGYIRVILGLYWDYIGVILGDHDLGVFFLADSPI